MEKLSLKESRKLVWITWFGILVTWGATIFAIITNMWIVHILAFLIVLWMIIRFFNKSKNIPKMEYPVVPCLFNPSAFFSLIIALVLVYQSSGEITPLAIEVGILSILYWILSIPESRYWNPSNSVSYV